MEYWAFLAKNAQLKRKGKTPPESGRVFPIRGEKEVCRNWLEG
jgi:hypothetical protein